VPATVFGLRIAQEVINEREEWKADDMPLDADWLGLRWQAVHLA